MSSIEIIGGTYHERCLWPDWDQVVGSGTRAAAALTSNIKAVSLHTYAPAQTLNIIETHARNYGFSIHVSKSLNTPSFDYTHCLSIPRISPFPNRIFANSPIEVCGKVVLRFGMLEGTAITKADRCIYDPQSAFHPEAFNANGSTAEHLAIVGNRNEIIALGQRQTLAASAKALLRAGAEVVVVKAGAMGAFVVEQTSTHHIPAFSSDNVWTIGSGDVFAAMFACCWGVRRMTPRESAKLASRAVASYANSMSLPVPSIRQLREQSIRPVTSKRDKVYLAGPFFTISQRWLIDESRRCLNDLGMDVFSPIHDVGSGPAHTVAPADLLGIKKCNVIFAILDGLDSGTVFEIGYARALGKPVYAFAQTTTDEDLKMVTGSGCFVFSDFVTALHRLAWRT